MKDEYIEHVQEEIKNNSEDLGMSTQLFYNLQECNMDLNEYLKKNHSNDDEDTDQEGGGSDDFIFKKVRVGFRRVKTPLTDAEILEKLEEKIEENKKNYTDKSFFGKEKYIDDCNSINDFYKKTEKIKKCNFSKQIKDFLNEEKKEELTKKLIEIRDKLINYQKIDGLLKKMIDGKLLDRESQESDFVKWGPWNYMLRDSPIQTFRSEGLDNYLKEINDEILKLISSDKYKDTDDDARRVVARRYESFEDWFKSFGEKIDEHNSILEKQMNYIIDNDDDDFKFNENSDMTNSLLFDMIYKMSQNKNYEKKNFTMILKNLEKRFPNEFKNPQIKHKNIIRVFYLYYLYYVKKELLSGHSAGDQQEFISNFKGNLKVILDITPETNSEHMRPFIEKNQEMKEELKQSVINLFKKPGDNKVLISILSDYYKLEDINFLKNLKLEPDIYSELIDHVLEDKGGEISKENLEKLRTNVSEEVTQKINEFIKKEDTNEDKKEFKSDKYNNFITAVDLSNLIDNFFCINGTIDPFKEKIEDEEQLNSYIKNKKPIYQELFKIQYVIKTIDEYNLFSNIEFRMGIFNNNFAFNNLYLIKQIIINNVKQKKEKYTEMEVNAISERLWFNILYILNDNIVDCDINRGIWWKRWGSTPFIGKLLPGTFTGQKIIYKCWKCKNVISVS